MKHGRRNEPWEDSSQGALRASKICSQTSSFRSRLVSRQSLKCNQPKTVLEEIVRPRRQLNKNQY